MTNEQTQAKENLVAAIKAMNEAKNLMNAAGVQQDYRHPRYIAWYSAERAYYNALSVAEDAGVVTVHNRSFSWVK